MSDIDHKNQQKNSEENSAHLDQYLSFIMAEEEYAISILDVVEIRCIEKMTPLPTAPVYVKGLINLRGTIIPIMDLRERFNMPIREYTPTTVIIILQSAHCESSKVIGIIVDTVSDVYNLNRETLKEAPDLMGDVCNEYINGLATIEKDNVKKMIIVLNVKQLIDVNDVSHLVHDEVVE